MQPNETNQSAARPAADFNPYAPGYDQNPYPALEKLRAEAQLQYWPAGRAWLLSRYDDAVAVLRDSKRFTADRSEWEFASVLGSAVLIPELEELNKYGLFSLANQDHARVRKLVSPALTPRAIERLKPEIQAIVEDVLDAAAAKGTIDVTLDFAEKIPARVIGSMLKMPKGREELFLRFTDAVVKCFLPGMVNPQELDGLRADMREGIELVKATIEDRRNAPLENDILTTLIQTEEQGERLNKGELLALASALIVGGFETTVHLIAFTIYNVLHRPEVLAQVRAEPDLLRNTIEEVLRHDNFGKMGIARYALEDVEMGGATIKKGQMLLVMLGSALRDSATFDKAEVFDVRRNTNASIAFGHGAHYCLGANLARLEVQLAVGAFLRRFPEMKLLGQPSFGQHPVIRKMESLKVQLNPTV
ncbi:cytochrome P450 [Archangium lansingense]|uniref:Cytochrome P450 n=1 Tax=Archangium lansingense TaxID=2995310 RepID=A0ABT4AM78_9BACT|nr:cytochrome P450 [Archangium lansinium]MCY1081922.1 cytochrome P450 [Archangium lansinium]